jgi:co-chaperonin GroES (HSP10)
MDVVEEKPLTALERKWQEQEKNREPVLDDAYDDEGNFSPNTLDQKVLSRLPRPTGWRIAILPYRGSQKTKGGIVLSEETQKRTQLATTVGYVLELGPLAFADGEKFPDGAWCKKGDWILFGRYAGARIPIDGGEIRFINDDEVIGLINDPQDILHM